MYSALCLACACSLQDCKVTREIIMLPMMQQFNWPRRIVFMIERIRHTKNASHVGGEPRITFHALPEEKCLEAVCVGAPLVRRHGRVRYPIQVQTATRVHNRGWKRQSYLVTERCERVEGLRHGVVVLRVPGFDVAVDPDRLKPRRIRSFTDCFKFAVGLL